MLRAQPTGFNTLDNWGHKKKIKKEKDSKEKIKGSWPGTCIQYTRLHLYLSAAVVIIIILMYIYHALIDALSAQVIHINLNIIFYTHVEHLPKQFT